MKTDIILKYWHKIENTNVTYTNSLWIQKQRSILKYRIKLQIML